MVKKKNHTAWFHLYEISKNRQIFSKSNSGCLCWWLVGGMGQTVKGYGISFGSDKHVPKLTCGDGCMTLNIQKITNVYTVNGWIAWHMHCISINLLQTHTKHYHKFLGETIALEKTAIADKHLFSFI